MPDSSVSRFVCWLRGHDWRRLSGQSFECATCGTRKMVGLVAVGQLGAWPASDASHVTEWQPRRQESKLEYVHHRAALAEHFAAMADLLEQMGQRPFGHLELRMPGNSFDSQVIYRWERPR